jgi:hypothetical protein
MMAGARRRCPTLTHSHRIRLEDLRKEEVRERLSAVWLDPLSLDPARRSVKVTREIAD